MLKVKKLHPAAKLPVCSHPGTALGIDFFSVERVLLKPFVPTVIATGVTIEFEDPTFRWEIGCLGRDRSSLGMKGILTLGGVIDADYRGELKVILMLLNPTLSVMTQDVDEGEFAPETPEQGYLIDIGDKVAQFIPLPVLTDIPIVEVPELNTTGRGEKGFGSTGK